MRNSPWTSSDPSDSINQPLTQVSWRSGSQIFIGLNIKGSGAMTGIGWRMPWYHCHSYAGIGKLLLTTNVAMQTDMSTGPTAGLLSPRNWHGHYSSVASSPHRLSEGFSSHLNGPRSCRVQMSLSCHSRNSFHLTERGLQKLLIQNRE